MEFTATVNFAILIALEIGIAIGWWLRRSSRTATRNDLLVMEARIMATQAEAAQQVRDLTAKINKIGTETAATLATVKKLQDIIDAGNGGQVSEELQTALNEAIAAAQSADDLTPDAPAPGE